MDQRRDSSNTHKGMEQRVTCILKDRRRDQLHKAVGSKRPKGKNTGRNLKKKKGIKIRGAEGNSKVNKSMMEHLSH